MAGDRSGHPPLRQGGGPHGVPPHWGGWGIPTPHGRPTPALLTNNLGSRASANIYIIYIIGLPAPAVRGALLNPTPRAQRRAARVGLGADLPSRGEHYP